MGKNRFVNFILGALLSSRTQRDDQSQDALQLPAKTKIPHTIQPEDTNILPVATQTSTQLEVSLSETPFFTITTPEAVIDSTIPVFTKSDQTLEMQGRLAWQ